MGAKKCGGQKNVNIFSRLSRHDMSLTASSSAAFEDFQRRFASEDNICRNDDGEEIRCGNFLSVSRNTFQ